MFIIKNKIVAKSGGLEIKLIVMVQSEVGQMYIF